MFDPKPAILGAGSRPLNQEGLAKGAKVSDYFVPFEFFARESFWCNGSAALAGP
jgi:hypothetical protein